MTDLELIEAAAQAAGYETQRYRVRELEVVYVREDGGEWEYFDPLQDDAHAFRLMVRMARRVASNGGHFSCAFAEVDGDRAKVRRSLATAVAGQKGLQ